MPAISFATDMDGTLADLARAKLGIDRDGGTITRTNAASSADESSDETPSYPEGLNAILMLSPTDVNGYLVPAPAGNCGERIRVRVPVFNRGGIGGRATRILVTPVLSATQDNWPFVIEAVDYTRGISEMRPGEIREIEYDLLISKEATTGVKEVKFTATYYNAQKAAYETAVFSIFINIIKGKTPAVTGAEGEEITTTPKIIIDSHTITPNKSEDGATIYGGETFTLAMRFCNKASETVQNIQITLENADGVLLPANGGSNTLYIDKIGAGDMVERTVQMQASAEAEPKSYKLSVGFGYESAKTLKSYEAISNISLPVRQRIRMRIDEPILEPQAMLGQSTYVYINIYNMGNSTVRNLMIDVEGEGLRMEETYFGGNLSSGQSAPADFGIIADTAGEIQGKIIITYEDAMQEVYTAEKPFTLTVMDTNAGMGETMIDPETGMMLDPTTGMPIDPETGMPVDGGVMVDSPGQKGGGMAPWLITVIGVVVLGGVAALILILRKKRRKKILEEV
ncbi:MAG: hypothetical protein LBS18_05900 [Clostridiales bacterium]|nr:hypothetical protein [Clostridiales bacterium]